MHIEKNLDTDGFPSVWLGIDLLMFGDIVTILEIKTRLRCLITCLSFNLNPSNSLMTYPGQIIKYL